MQENIMAVNIANAQTIEVYWQDEVVFNLDVQLMWVKSGQQEINKYVAEVSLPKIEKFTSQTMDSYVDKATAAADLAVNSATAAQNQAKIAATNSEKAQNSATAAAESVQEISANTEQSLQKIATCAQTAQTEIKSVETEAKSSIKNAANDYVEKTIKPDLQQYVDKTANSATAAANSADEAKATASSVSDNLQNKADVDAGNFSATGKSLLAGLSLPENKFTELTLGASGASYTAPANGYFCVGGFNDTAATASVTIRSNGVYVRANAGAGEWGCAAVLPVSKGTVVQIKYANITTFDIKRFVKAQGEN